MCTVVNNQTKQLDIEKVEKVHMRATKMVKQLKTTHMKID